MCGAARTTAGSRKALTPLLIASTPVIAVQPEANERMRSQKVAAVAAAGIVAGAATGSGLRPPAGS